MSSRILASLSSTFDDMYASLERKDVIGFVRHKSRLDALCVQAAHSLNVIYKIDDYTSYVPYFSGSRRRSHKM